MNHPLAWGVLYDSQTPAGSSGELPALVRAAAEELVADLRRAEKLTGGWSDQPLTDALAEAALSTCLGRLAGTNIWGEANRLPSSGLWQIAGSLLDVGTPIERRAACSSRPWDKGTRRSFSL